MDETFISFACDILGKTAGGLTGSEIGKYFVEYSMKFNRKIKTKSILVSFENGKTKYGCL